MLNPQRLAVFFLLVLGWVVPFPAQAYIGPGAGLGAIAVTVALLLGVLLLLVGLVWYPLKRFMKGRKRAADGQGETDGNK